MKIEYANKILVDCFLKYKNEYLMVKRKSGEVWFPGFLGSIWREVKNGQNPHEVLQSILKEFKVNYIEIKLKAIANNVFYDLKENFYVFLFIVDVKEKPSIKELPEGEKIIWIKSDLKTTEKILEEYKKVFPKFKEDKILFYHNEYDFTKLLKTEFYGYA